jgi:hypothetical protein
LGALIAAAPKVVHRGDERDLAGFGDWLDVADLDEGCAV